MTLIGLDGKLALSERLGASAQHPAAAMSWRLSMEVLGESLTVISVALIVSGRFR